MVSIEQRVEKVEVRVDAQQQLISGLLGNVQAFRRDTAARFVQIDARFVQVDARFVQLDQKMDAGLARLDGRIDGLDRKLDAHRHETSLQFRWLVGILLTGMATIAAAILAQ